MTHQKFTRGDRVRVLSTHFLEELHGRIGTIEDCPLQVLARLSDQGANLTTTSHWVVFLKPDGDLQPNEIDAGMIPDFDLEYVT
jgi:hypothetical protein